MSIQTCIKQAADEKFGPLAAAIILNGDFSQGGSFDPFFEMLHEELVEVQITANFYLQQERGDMLRLELSVGEGARALVLMIQAANGKTVVVPSAPSGAVVVQPPLPAPSGAMVAPSTPFHVGREPKEDPNGSNTCFVRDCGKRFLTFNDVMAHKVLAHGYSHPKYTKAWAENVVQCLPAGLTVPLGTPSTTASEAPDPGKVTQSTLWTPTLNLDLNDLGLAPGEASRFAAGEEATARFYFIRRLNKATRIKGKFVWTKFAHRFNWEDALVDDFVVRKLAGDTKEWVGLQKANGVWNPASTHSNGLPRMHHQGRYVGDHEADIEAIISNPRLARVNYGKWRQECGYCGRNLTDPESRLRGIGPDCWEEKYLPSLIRQRAKP